MSLIQFLRILMARKAIILAAMIACFIAATITVQLLPQRFEATNRVLIDVTKPGAMLGPVTRDTIGSYISTQIKLITDVRTAGVVIDELGWAQNPAYQAAFEEAGRPGGDIRDWLAQRIIDATQARLVPGSSIAEITYRGTDPASTQRIAEAIREAWLKTNREQRVSTAQRSAAAYEEQARRALEEVTKSEQERTQFAKANGIVVTPGNVDLETSKLSILSSATVGPTSTQVTPGTGANPQVAILRQQIAQAQQTLGPNHPNLQALQRQLAAVQSAQGTAPTVVQGTTRADIESAYQAQKARVLAQSDKMDRLNSMQADIAVKREQYAKLVAKAEEMKAVATSGESALEPLGNTNLPNQAVWPNKPLVIIGSLLLGAALGVLLALLVELIARRVRSDADLEFASGVPVLAVVGQQQSDNFVLAWLRRVLDRDGTRSTALAEA